VTPWSQVTTSSFFVSTPGTYTVKVTNANQPDGTSASATATFEIVANGSIVPSPVSFSPTLTRGGSASMATLSLGAAPDGITGAANVSTQSGGSWLKINGELSANWITPQALNISFDPTGLAAGNYQGSITLTSPNAPNSPVVVPVALAVLQPLAITSSTLPDAYSGEPYTSTLQTNGGTGLSWTIQSGVVPTGLTLDPTTGAITGTPGFVAGAVVQSVTISVKDSLGRVATQAFVINWRPGVSVSAPTFGTPQWVVGSAVPASVGSVSTASGGSPPYHWQATGLPPGINLSQQGVLTGAPSVPGNYSVAFLVTDSGGLKGTLSITIPVVLLPLAIRDDTFGNTPPVAPPGAVGSAYQGFYLGGAGGSQSGYQWSIAGLLPSGVTAGPPVGCIPPGCSVGFSGTPLQAGTFPVIVQLADSANNTVATSLTFMITAAPQSVTFGVLASVTFGVTPFAMSANATSGLVVAFTSTTPSVCAVSGSTVTVLAVGACSITASQPGNANFAAAAAISQTFTVNQASQTIAFASLSNVSFGASPFGITATASSGLAVGLASTTPTVCAISGNTVTLLAVGTCTIMASQGGNANYAAALPVGQSFTVSQASQTITFGALSAASFGIAPFSVSATASSGLAVAFASTTLSVCTVSGTSVTIVTVGTCSIAASQPGNTNYSPALAVIQAFTVNKAPQTITFTAPNNVSFGSAPLLISATATSGLAVSFTSTTPTVCTVSANTVTIGAIGACSIAASQTGNANFAAAPPVTKGFTVVSATQSITFGLLSNIAFGSAPLSISASASSGLAVSFASTTPTVCTVGGSTVTTVSPGLCSITASQSGNLNYPAATPVIRTFAVSPVSQSSLSDNFNGTSFDVTKWNVAIVPAGNGTVTETNQRAEMLHSTSGISSYLGLQSLWKLRGDFDVQVDFGLLNWIPQNFHTVRFSAPDLPQGPLGVVGIYRNSYTSEGYQMRAVNGVAADIASSDTTGKLRLVRVGSTISGYYWDGTQFVLLASSPTTTDDTGITLDFSSPNTTSPANVSIAFDNFLVNTGTAAIVSQVTQTITFGSLSNVMIGAQPFAISATASSGLAVSFASTTPQVCTLTGTTVTVVATGMCSITASQPGNVNYAAAANVTQTFTIIQSQSITFAPLSAVTLPASPVTLAATATSNLPVSFTSNSTAVCTVSGSIMTLVAVGTCSITANQAGNGAFLAATAVTRTFAVTQPVQNPTVTLAVGDGNGFAGDTVEIPIQLTSVGTPALSTFQFDLNFDSQKLTFKSARAGAPLTAASKSISTSTQPSGDIRLLAVGFNQNVISNGVVAYATFTLGSPFTASAVTPKACTSADAQGSIIGTACTAGTIKLPSCDINADGSTNVADVQLIINEALGVSPATHDLNHDGAVNVADVQKVINAALGLGCSVQ
jgi:hypothetical protein